MSASCHLLRDLLWRDFSAESDISHRAASADKSCGKRFCVSLKGLVFSNLALLKNVPHTLTLGIEVAAVVIMRGNAQRHLLDDLKPMAGEPHDLTRVIGQQP